jgi:hypothetical protein
MAETPKTDGAARLSDAAPDPSEIVPGTEVMETPSVRNSASKQRQIGREIFGSTSTPRPLRKAPDNDTSPCLRTSVQRNWPPIAPRVSLAIEDPIEDDNAHLETPSRRKRAFVTEPSPKPTVENHDIDQQPRFVSTPQRVFEGGHGLGDQPDPDYAPPATPKRSRKSQIVLAKEGSPKTPMTPTTNKRRKVKRARYMTFDSPLPLGPAAFPTEAVPERLPESPHDNNTPVISSPPSPKPSLGKEQPFNQLQEQPGIMKPPPAPVRNDEPISMSEIVEAQQDIDLDASTRSSTTAKESTACENEPAEHIQHVTLPEHQDSRAYSPFTFDLDTQALVDAQREFHEQFQTPLACPLSIDPRVEAQAQNSNNSKFKSFRFFNSQASEDCHASNPGDDNPVTCTQDLVAAAESFASNGAKSNKKIPKKSKISSKITKSDHRVGSGFRLSFKLSKPFTQADENFDPNRDGEKTKKRFGGSGFESGSPTVQFAEQLESDRPLSLSQPSSHPTVKKRSSLKQLHSLARSNSQPTFTSTLPSFNVVNPVPFSTAGSESGADGVSYQMGQHLLSNGVNGGHRDQGGHDLDIESSLDEIDLFLNVSMDS